MVPASPELDALVPHAGGERLSHLMEAISGGVQAAYRAQSIPYAHVRLPNTSEASVGALMQMEMVEMMLLAKLMHLNAFDQPAVEAYKKETKRILAEGK
ncbi:Glucose-6-phosphate isomerase [uncultured archaeon]|nr:Glucose-6-phosphate isomerase [uncultured archaeon]